MQAHFYAVVRLYRGWALWASLILFPAFSVGCIALAVWSWTNPDPADTFPTAFLLVFAIGGPSGIWHALRNRITLDGPCLEKHVGPRVEIICHSEILGFRLQGRDLVLVSKDDNIKSVTVPARLLTDPQTAPWFEDLTDLNHAREKMEPHWAGRVASKTSSVHPIIVRLHRGWRLWVRLVASVAFSAAVGGLCIWELFHPKVDGLPFGPIVLTAMGLWSIATTWRDRVVFYATWLELRKGARNIDVSRADLLGYRLRGRHIILMPKDEAAKTVRLPATVLRRDDTAAWFDGLVDLDEACAANPQDAVLGKQATARRAARERLQRIAGVLSVLAFLICVWVWFYPRPYFWAISAASALPLLALMLNQFTGGALCFSDNDGALPRASIVSLLGFPTSALGLRLILDYQFLDWWPLVAWSAGLGVAIALYLVLRDRGLRRSRDGMLGVLLGSVAYCAGILGQFNYFLDDAPIEKYPVTVLHTQSTYSNHMNFFVKVTPWGPVRDNNSIMVPDGVYFRFHEGDEACVYLSQGFFGFATYDLGEC